MYPKITSIASKTFTSNINIDNGYTSVSQGTYEYSMELTKITESTYNIEWIIPALDHVTQIGIYTSANQVTDYDGVFELPSQAIELLEENNLNCQNVKS